MALKPQYLLKAGDVLGGRYEIMELAARGGMSAVYRARDRRTGRIWAVKAAVKSDPLSGERAYAGAAAERDILCRLSHPSLPGIADVMEDEESIFLVMDFIEGTTLERLVEKSGPMGEEEAVAAALALADVLSYLHSQSPPVIYRDMKPSNVMMRRDGSIVLFDFGIARKYRPGASSDTCLLGTPGYAAPEQFGGHQTDERTDVFGLGATLAYLLTGISPALPPFVIPDIRKCAPSLSSALAEIISRATENDPSERYQSVEGLTSELCRYKELEAGFLRRERGKIGLFILPLAIGAASLAASFQLWTMKSTAREDAYAAALSAAEEKASVSLGRRSRAGSETEGGSGEGGEEGEGALAGADVGYGEALAGADGEDGEGGTGEVIGAFLAAAAIAPERKESYMELLSYAAESGELASGIAAVTGRVDALGDAEGLDELCYTLGWMLFEKGTGAGGRPDDLRRAASYFSKADGDRYPDAALYASIASALGSYSNDVDWGEMSALMSEFSRVTLRRGLDVQKIRNALVYTGICLAREYELSIRGGDPLVEAVSMAETGIESAEKYLSNKAAAPGGDRGAGERAEVRRYKKELTLRLADALMRQGGGALQAAEVYGELAATALDEDEKRAMLVRRAEALRAAGDPRGAADIYRNILREDPDDPDIWLALSASMLESGDAEGAEQVFDEAKDRDGIREAGNYSALAARFHD